MYLLIMMLVLLLLLVQLSFLTLNYNLVYHALVGLNPVFLIRAFVWMNYCLHY